MKTILIHSDIKGLEAFLNVMSSNLNDFKIVTTINDENISDIEVVVLWLEVPNYLERLCNLKLILSCGSGVDHIINSPNLPKKIPLIRLVDPYLRNRVSNYVSHQVNEYYRLTLENNTQLLNQLEILDSRKKSEFRIGIMGLGLIGSAIAEKLISNGFKVTGWTKTEKNRKIETVYVGEPQLEEFAKTLDVLVCQLPLTPETKGILNTRLFNLLPDGTFLINTARGSHLNEDDLLLALDSGKISFTCLDVLEPHQLKKNHPFNLHEKIKITPHVAGYIGPDTQAPYASSVIKDFYNNKSQIGTVDYLSNY